MRKQWPSYAELERERQTALAQLEIVRLVDIEGHSFAQVATITKKTPQAVGSLYCRAKLKGRA